MHISVNVHLYVQTDVLSRDRQEQLHSRVQDMLRSCAVASRSRRKHQLSREALLGRLEMDANLLLSE